MPYNFMGDLYKGEIVSKLNELGYNIKNVHELNLILEEMGIQEHSGKDWITTDRGVGYTIYNSRVANADAWHPEIIDEIVNYLN